MGQSRKIKDALITLLTGLQYNGEAAFQGLADNTATDFDGYPILRLLPNMIENRIETNTENDREVRYHAVVHLPLEDPEKIQADVINQLYDLTDIIMDALDEGDQQNSLTTIDPTIGQYMMQAQSANWDVVDSKGGALIMLVIEIAVTYSKELSNGLH